MKNLLQKGIFQYNNPINLYKKFNVIKGNKNLKKEDLVLNSLGFIPSERLEYHGTNYGGWPILLDHLNQDSICYCGGAGLDISFEKSLSEKYNCNFIIIEPIKKYIEKLKPQVKNFEKIKFINLGLDKSENILNFNNAGGISYSHFHRENKTESIDTIKLSNLMKQNNHSRLDLFKMDIEGSEYGIIDDIIENNLDIDVINVEFHGNWMGGWKSDSFPKPPQELYLEGINKLFDYGYYMAWAVGLKDHMFIKKELI